MVDLWASQAEAAVKATAAQDAFQREQDRQMAAYKRLAMLSDDYKTQVEDRMQPYFSTATFNALRDYVNTTTNILKGVVNRRSKVYGRAPKRVFKGASEDAIAKVEDLYRRLRVDQKMKRANRIMNTVNDVALQPVWRGRTETSPGEMDLDILTPDKLAVVNREDDPTRVERVLVVRDDSPDTPGSPNSKIWRVWSDTEHFLTDNSGARIPIGGNEDMVNPYGVMPFVWIHRQQPDAAFWNETEGEDLYQLNLVVAIRQTLLDFSSVWQSFKQLAITGQDDVKIPDGMIVSPDTAIKVTGMGVAVSVLDLQAAFDMIRTDLKNLIAGVVTNYGISSDAFSENVTQVTGKALRIMNSSLEDAWQDQIEVFRSAEYDLLRLILRVHEVEAGEKLDVELEKIEFAPMATYNDEAEELALSEKKIKMGIEDPVEVFQRYHPGMGYDDAMQKMLSIAEVNGRLAEYGWPSRESATDAEPMSE